MMRRPRGSTLLPSTTLSRSAGPNTLTASSSGLSGSPVTFSAAGTAGTAATGAANKATSQSATAGTAGRTPPPGILQEADGETGAPGAPTLAQAPRARSVSRQKNKP